MYEEAKSLLRTGTLLIGISLFPFILLSGASYFGMSLPEWIEAIAFLFLYFCSFLTGIAGTGALVIGFGLIVFAHFRSDSEKVPND